MILHFESLLLVLIECADLVSSGVFLSSLCLLCFLHYSVYKLNFEGLDHMYAFLPQQRCKQVLLQKCLAH